MRKGKKIRKKLDDRLKGYQLLDKDKNPNAYKMPGSMNGRKGGG